MEEEKKDISFERTVELIYNSRDRLAAVDNIPAGEEKTVFLKRESKVYLKRAWELWWRSTKILKRAWSLWLFLRIPWRKDSDRRVDDKHIKM